LHSDFGVGAANSLPALGSRSQGIRVISQTWSPNHESLTLEVAGIAGASYELPLWNPEQLSSAEGAKLQDRKLLVKIPASESEPYPHQKIILHFFAKR
jgi:hypothetical protein